MRHVWETIADDGTTQTWKCLRCMGVLKGRGHTPDARVVRTFTLGADVQRLSRMAHTPVCAGRGEVIVRLQGRHMVRVRG